MSLTEFLPRREGWLRAAPEATRALVAGDPSPAAALLGSWRFAQETRWLQAVTEQLASLDFAPAPAALAVTLGQPQVPAAATPHEWREVAWEHPGPPPADADPRAWALAELAALGWLVDATGRGAWARSRVVPDEAADARAAALWRGWVDLSIFARESAWERLTLEPMLRGFGAVLRGRRVPEDRVRMALADAREGWFPYLYGGDGDSMSWRELAVRVLEEAGGQGPVQALAEALPADRWSLVGGCAVTRGYGPETARLVWGERSAWLVQAREVERLGAADAGTLEALLDLHVACRLLQRWQSPGPTAPERSWNVVVHNRGRARARLRAVLREAPADWLVERLVALPALAARTRRAVARFGRDWAWQCHQHGLTFSDARTLDPACHAAGVLVAPYSVDERAMLRAWVLSVLLKDRLPHLEAWVTRRAADGVDLQDTTWGRLLSDECPAPLRDAGPGASRDDGLQRLRAELVEHLPSLLRQLHPVVEQVAAIEIRPRRMQAAFDAAVAPVAHPTVKPLAVQYRRYVEAARRALGLLQSRAEARPEDEEDEA